MRRATCASDITTFRLATVACRMSVAPVARLSARSCQTLHVADTRAAVASARHQTEITKLPYGGRR